MKERATLDLTNQSVSYPNTPAMPFLQLPFYVESCGHFHANPSYYTHREGMKSHLMIYTLSGYGQLIHEGIGYQLNPNSLIAFNCTSPHFYHTQSNEPWEFIYIHYNGSSAALYTDLLNDHNLSVLSVDQNPSISKAMFAVLQLIKTNGHHKELIISQTLTTLYTNILTTKKTSPDKVKHLEYTVGIQQVIDYIQQHYKEKISTDDLASIVALSKYHFMRLFKNHIGLSPYEYLINYRINTSKTLLKETTNGVGTISELVGFGDVNNYIRYFKKLVGTTPGAYRKAMKFDFVK